ncbi:MAG: hypothetical protein HWD59_03920 [Coxiellaceae bacterium]|nr:MAG: hypothetical protein HWD59_03920 [Coxiellaceae bacterium]
MLKLGNKIDAICDHYGVEYSDETNDFVNYESSRFQRKINQVYEQFSKILGSINQLNRLLKDEKKCRIKFEQYTLPPTATEFVFNFDNQTLINCIFGISIKQSSFVNTTFDKIIFSKTSSCYAKTLIGLNNKDQIQFYGHAEYSIDQAEIGSDIDWDNVAREIDQVIRITPDAVAKLVQINLILQTIENNRERSERAKERIEILENEIDDQLDAPLPNDENHDILEDAETSADLAKK